MSGYHTYRIKRGAMVRTASTSEADQPHVPGAIAVRVSGIVLILLGGYRLYAVISNVVELEGVYSEFGGAYVGLFLSGVLGLLTLVAGIRLVRLAGRTFGLVVCSVVLALEVISYGLKVVVLKFVTSSPTQSIGMLFWLLHPFTIVVFLVVIILIARWHPPREIEQLGRIFD
jgi:hypothetical protein